MGRMTNLILLMIAIQVCLFLFAGTDPLSTAIWQAATNPFSWATLSFFGSIVFIASGLGFFGAWVGTLVGIKTDFMVFAVLITGLISLGYPIVGLAGVLQAHSAGVFCPGIADPLSCPMAIVITAITTGALTIYYMLTVVAWWRGRTD